MAQIARPEVFIDQGSFDPKKMLGSKWQVITGDKRNIGLDQIDLSRVTLDSTLRKGESSLSGHERHARLLASGNILLGPDVFYELWKDQHLIPHSWEEPICGESSIITFDGGYLFGPPSGIVRFRRPPTRYVLYLIALEQGYGWGRGVRSINEHFSGRYRAATLPWDYKRK